MQDKELDELFRSKLNDLEAQPSAKVWPGITAGLDAGKRRKSIAPFLNIAASVLILVAAGILFITQKEVKGNKPHAGHKLPKTTGQVAVVTTTDSMSSQVAVSTSVKTPVNKAQTLALHDKQTYNTRIDKPADTTAQTITTVKNDNQTLVAVTPQTQHNTSLPLVPDEPTPLYTTTIAEPTHTIPVKPVAIAATAVPNIKTDAAPVKQRHKIRNLGDLVNLVVAKVDKRNGKLIDEDGESNIIGVNLGVLKLKKEE